MSQPLEEQTDGDPISRLILAVQQVAEKVDSIEARQNQSAVTEKPLKSARLDVQVQLNVSWINRLNQLNAEIGGNEALSAVLEDMKARNLLLRKADAQPAFFKFFEDRQAAHPDLSLAQCDTEALDKFNEIEVIKPATLNSATGRKRPFPRGGGNGSRVPAAFGYRDPSVAILAAQVQHLQQQMFAGYNSLQPAARPPRTNTTMCFNCRGFGHMSKQCPQGQSSSRQ
ncbi:hypothetical protein QR680_007734 [Steinernema hermaphroditum]|uniref:CCHC-type domain-containing protein n=1 Tax=Steinernema hermaphroditum TaxID=289476 RepID=A0AA39M6V6_9BILA|nr:hypothetical protein QR680_007734 [Steinernema hermaphroditum]